ncbi:MAG: SAM-dependent methyltransferase [Acidobacteriota bacterium]
MTSNPTELELRLIERIGRDGPITFRDFMQAALYDSDFGYYNTERLKIGAGGDYYTSSNVHPAFGAVLARAFVEMWRGLGGDGALQPLRIVEIGAGTGRLACDVLAALRDQHEGSFRGVEYVIAEASPVMRRRESEMLVGFGGQVRSCGLDELARSPTAGIFFSNELIDALPVHRVRSRQAQIEEQYVTVASERLALSWAEPSTPKLTTYLERAGAMLTEGQFAEINLDSIEWLAQAARAIDRGFLLTIDYGDVSPLLYAQDRREGTLRSFRNHRLVDSLLEWVGEQDLTASVNFTALMQYGRDFGLETVSYERQVAFLIRKGLIDMIAERENTNPSREELRLRLALKNLFVPGGVSDNFRVLIQKKARPEIV